MSVLDEIIKSLASPQGNASTAATTYRADAKERAKGTKLVTKRASDIYLKVRSIPARVLMTPGGATTYSSFGLYMPRLNSTVGDEMDLLASTLTAPFDAELAYGAGWTMKHPLQTWRIGKLAVLTGILAVRNLPVVRDYNITFPKNRLYSGIPVPTIEKIPEELRLINVWREAAAKGDKEVGNKALLEWWKLKAPNSKPVDVEGNPVVIYHGTNKRGINIYDPSKGGSNTGEVLYKDHITGELIPGDATGTIMGSDNKVVGLNYAFLGTLNDIDRIRLLYDRSRGIPGRPSLTSPQILEFKELVSKYPTLKEAYASGDDIAFGKALHDFPDARSITNLYSYYLKAKLNLQSLVDNWQRLVKNDLSVPFSFGPLSDYSVTLSSGLNGKGFHIFSRDGKVMFSFVPGNGKPSKVMAAEDIKNPQSVIDWVYDVYSKGLNAYKEEAKPYFDNAVLNKLFMKIDNPVVHNYNGSAFPDVYINTAGERTKYPTSYVAARQVNKARKEGNDGFIYKLIRDPNEATNYGVFDSRNIKSAEPFTYDDKGNLIDITKRFNFNNPDIRYYKEGEMLPSSSNTFIEYAPYKGTDEQLLEEALNGVYDSLDYPNTPHFEKQALLVFDKSELPELRREMTELNQLSGLGVKRYDEGLHLIGENNPSAIWDPNDNILVESYVTINPDFAGKVSPYTTASHEVGGHGFNGHMTGLEDPNIVNKFAQLKLQGFSDKQILLAAISYLTKGKGLELKEALDQAWGYLFATKYPKIFKMMQYNALKQRELLRVKPGVTVSKYKSDPDELTTRARTGHILAAALNTEAPVYTDDMVKLEDSYTPESLKAYLKVALGLIPFLGLGTASSLLTKPNNYVEKIL